MKTDGLTLLELLVVIAILALLAGLALFGLTRQISEARHDEVTHTLAQTITGLRNKALRSGVSQQVTLTSTGYLLVSLAQPPVQVAVATPDVQFTPLGVTLTCSTKGFCTAQDALAQPVTLSTITASSSTRPRTITLTLLGLTRVQ